MSSPSPSSELPEADAEVPSRERRLLISVKQAIGLTLLASLVVAPFFGAFEAGAQRRVTSGGLSLELGYPARANFFSAEQISLHVRARPACLSPRISFAGSFFRAATELDAQPRFTKPFLISTERPIDAQGSDVLVQFRLESVGKLEGSASLGCADGRSASVPFSTFVFP